MKPLQSLLTGIAAYVVLEKVLTGNVATSASYCPYPTQNIGLNTKNRNYAAKNFMYGPLNPAAPNDDYWQALAEVFKPKGVKPTQEDIAAAKKALCGNCGVFDISPRMQKCLPPLTDADEYDKYALASGSVLGYCWVHHFKCASKRTCETWVVGGPIRDDERSKKMSARFGKGSKRPVGS
jgi:hypothetical protein